MSFNDNARLDTSQVGSGGGRGGRGVAVGGGLGGIILLVVAGLLFGQDGIDMVTGGGQQQQRQGSITSVAEQDRELAERCQTGADADRYDDCRQIATVNSLNEFWGSYYPQATGERYEQPGVMLYNGVEQSGCGQASAAVGPFYCPVDTSVYLDVGFFDQMRESFGASANALAQEYVMAHEVGHHIQNLQGADSGAVRVELQADCYAGMWAHHASQPGGSVSLEPITNDQLADALNAAQAIGDDRIQETTQGRANPESFTHGSSAQRQAWFLSGYQTGDINQCDTFSSRNLDRPAGLRG
ncbi:neutral zinc metallopeptidase [Kocuria sp. cx-455]|uniref:KPN_02809 family neutral zinc metallopeptidase n=1 Tax=Kocuria sp. cx-455 TaxID=2771377 RepID=UPI0016836447|nr:neutral zinc metallopeptidase [Kocuria sp. cx-455]MBD2764987.1 neutral zinc metallopeptidase [Kocuria sp. cx-455]